MFNVFVRFGRQRRPSEIFLQPQITDRNPDMLPFKHDLLVSILTRGIQVFYDMELSNTTPSSKRKLMERYFRNKERQILAAEPKQANPTRSY